MHNQICRSSVSALLIFALLFTGLFYWPDFTYAETQEVEVTHYRLDTGSIFIWCNSSEVWQSGKQPNGPYTYQASINIGKGKKDPKITAYNKKNFDFEDSKYYTWYSTKKADDKIAYDFNYWNDGAKINSASVTGYDKNTGILSFTVNTTLTANDKKPYDVVYTLETRGKQEILDLLGGTANKELESFMNKTDFGDKVKGQLYFVPTVISWTETEIQEVPDPEPEPIPLELNAVLGLPNEAKVGESYEAADKTILPKDAKFKSSTLEKNDGSGWTFVSAWDGTKAGSSLSETAAKEGPITYRLTVTLQSGESDTDTKTINILDGTVVDATAILSLPSKTYESHPVTAEDGSTYVVDGENYSALRAYEERKASNRFSILESGAGQIKKDRVTPIYATATFPNKGFYNVQLKISPKNGGSLYDTKPIEVLKTPTVLANLGGTQKQNRKQVLTIKVATNADNPLKQLWAEVTNLETGESVHLTQNFDGRENTLDNTEGIKTRPIEKLESDPYWNNCQLLFLTKNTKPEKFRYKVYAKDSRGLWDAAEQEFTVQPDLPPKAEISVQDAFFREKGTNTATIEMEDVSSTDGDQIERNWYITEDSDLDERFEAETEVKAEEKTGFTDSSFGTKKIISVKKTGVGKVKLRLHVKDVWTEETLEEYITEEDYLTDETIAITKIDNIAPIVSLKPITTRTADILLLAGSVEEYKKLKNGINTMQSYFLGNAVDADVKVKLLDEPLERDYPWYRYFVAQPYGYNGDGTAFEDRCFLVDNHGLYTIEGTWHAGENYWNSYVSPPYILRAFDANCEYPLERWNARLYDMTQLPLNAEFRFEQDDSEQYLYFVCNGKTALFTKDNGTLLTVLPFEVGESNFVSGDLIYTVKSNGIYAINGKKGGIQTIVKGNLSEKAKMINGKVHFALVESTNLKRGILDLTSGLVQYEALGKADREGYHLIGIDNKGVMVFTAEEETRYEKSDYYIHVYNRENHLIKTHTVYLREGQDCITPVSDSNGTYNYITWATASKSKSSYHCGASVIGIYNGVEKSCDVRSKSKRTTTNIIYTEELPSGEVYVITGAYYIDTTGGYHIYPERARAFVYNPQSGEMYEKKNGLMGGIGDTDEYGMHSDAFIAVHCGDNNMEQQKAKSTTTLIKRSRTLDQVITSFLNRNLDGTKNMRAVGLYDHSLTSTNSFWRAEQILRKEGYDFYCLTDQERNTYGENLARRLNGTVLVSEKPTEEMAQRILSKDKQESVLEIKANAEDASFTKSLPLQTGKEYFYEYEIKSRSDSASDPSPIKERFQSGLSFTPLISESLLTGETVTVSDVVKESFDNKINPMFRFSSNEVFEESNAWNQSGFIEKTSAEGYDYRYPKGIGKLYGVRKRKSNGPITANMKFNIPSGKRAALSFDYEMCASSNNLNRHRIDGKIEVNGFSFTPPNEKYRGYYESSGRYTYPGLLYSGETEIKITLTSHEYGISGYLFIDNLQLILIDEEAPSQMQPNIQTKESGWSTVSGSFQTPGEIAYYGALKSSYSSNPNAFYYRGKTYVPAMRFHQRGNLGFSFKKDETVQIRNLKVYCIEGGKKIYAIQDTFNRESPLSGWNKNKVTTQFSRTELEEEEDKLVYKKGEWIRYGINYYDYENDPSKKQYWRYTHTPFNDGSHPNAATVLNEEGNVVFQDLNKVLNQPIQRFYVDGKYTVEHWQEDDTSRRSKAGGNPLYDKASNIESLTFYIEGGASAPWITSIKTVPKTVKEGDAFRIQVGVDDAEKDTLRLTTEVYKEKKLLYTHRRTGLNATNGSYPLTTTGTVQKKAQSGTYEVVCTVRDHTGAGIGTYRFTVISEGKITGMVYHTENWEKNRKKYNLNRFKDEVNKEILYTDYLKLKAPRKRGTNVFWSGEKFMLQAEAAGSPTKVTCKIEGYPSYSTTMKNTGKKNAANETIYSGSLWESSMLNKWGRKKPKELTFTFTATYSAGTTKTYTAKIIVDSKEDYWQLHRAF